jgi:hypothetical protein
VRNRGWISTGQREQVGGHVDRVSDFDPRRGDHYWTVNVSYHVDPARMVDPAATPTLDHETLVLLVGPVCFHCEQVFTPLLASRRCRGHG